MSPRTESLRLKSGTASSRTMMSASERRTVSTRRAASALRYQTLNKSTLNVCCTSSDGRGGVVKPDTLSDAVIAMANAPAPVHVRPNRPARMDKPHAAMIEGNTKWDTRSRAQCTDLPQNANIGIAQSARAQINVKLSSEFRNLSMTGPASRRDGSTSAHHCKGRDDRSAAYSSCLTALMLSLSIISSALLQRHFLIPYICSQ